MDVDSGPLKLMNTSLRYQDSGNTTSWNGYGQMFVSNYIGNSLNGNTKILKNISIKILFILFKNPEKNVLLKVEILS